MIPTLPQVSSELLIENRVQGHSHVLRVQKSRGELIEQLLWMSRGWEWSLDEPVSVVVIVTPEAIRLIFHTDGDPEAARAALAAFGVEGGTGL